MQIACGEVGSADWLGVTLGAERDEPDRAEHGARRNVRLLRVVLQISIGSRRGHSARHAAIMNGVPPRDDDDDEAWIASAPRPI